MWNCKSCGRVTLLKALEPEIDRDGCYFQCPGCGHRNALANDGVGDDIAQAHSDS